MLLTRPTGETILLSWEMWNGKKFCQNFRVFLFLTFSFLTANYQGNPFLPKSLKYIIKVISHILSYFIYFHITKKHTNVLPNYSLLVLPPLTISVWSCMKVRKPLGMSYISHIRSSFSDIHIFSNACSPKTGMLFNPFSTRNLSNGPILPSIWNSSLSISGI